MNQENNEKGILLESGTNELEIVEFNIAEAVYGINIAKVREIIKADITIVSVPDSHSSLDGAINLRGVIIPVVNLARHLNEDAPFDKKNNRIVVCEFNKIVVGFLVTAVARIHRLSWAQIEEPSDMLQTKDGYAVGVIKIGEQVLFLLDFEKIASHINPKAGMVGTQEANYTAPESKVDRSSKTILIAEDSEFIRDLIVDYIDKAGYKLVTASNGELAWQHLAKAIQSPDFDRIEDHFNLLITDIEMPQMDGLHLIKKIKDEVKLRKLPCIAFSSMITKELQAKCQSIGSDGEIAKPDIDQLVKLVDNKVI